MKKKECLIRNPSIYNIICWFAGPMGQTTRRPCFWCSKYFFFIESCKILCKTLSIYISYKITKIRIKSFECPKSIRKFEKKVLGTSDTWSMSRLSDRSSKPAYYIVDCRISERCNALRRHIDFFVFIYKNPKLREPKLCCYMQNAGGFCMIDSMKDLGHFYRFILLKNSSFFDVNISIHVFVACSW